MKRRAVHRTGTTNVFQYNGPEDIPGLLLFLKDHPNVHFTQISADQTRVVINWRHNDNLYIKPGEWLVADSLDLLVLPPGHFHQNWVLIPEEDD